MADLDSDLMRHFLAVAQTGNVTRAADRLGRTQSAVSMQIRRLEETVGAALFERRARGMEMNAKGRALLPYAERVVSLLDDAAARLRAAPLSGPVRVGVVDEYVGSVVPSVLAQFAACHPEVSVTVLCDFSRRQRNAIAEDRLDLGVCFDWDGTTGGETLCIDPTVWITSETFAQHERRPVPVGLYVNSDWSRDYAVRALDQAGVDWWLSFEADNAAALEKAALAGLAVVPRARSTVPPGTRALTDAEGFPTVDQSRVVLLSNPRRSAPAIEALREALRAAFRPGARALAQEPG